MQLKKKLMPQCIILLEHCILASSSTGFFKVIHLVICFHELKIWYHHGIQTQTTHREWVITFLNKIHINKDISKIHYRNIYNIIQLNTIHITSPLYHLKFIFQLPFTLHMNQTLESRRSNTYQFHNKQFTDVMQHLYLDSSLHAMWYHVSEKSHWGA